MARFVPGLKTNGLYPLVKPSGFIRSQVDEYADDRLSQFRMALSLSGFYAVNLVLYAGPLTLAGFGSPLVQMAPLPLFETFVGPIYPDVVTAWDFVLTLAQNSLYLLAISVLTLVTYHVGIWLTRSSRGVLQSAHTVVFSTGIYLAAIFTLTWYLSTAAAIAVADDFLIFLQKRFVYFIIDSLGSNLGLPGGRPEPVALVDITLSGKLALTGLLLSLGYYLYSLYLGSRINHGTSRFDALIATLFVALSPAVYVTGSVVVYLISNRAGLGLIT